MRYARKENGQRLFQVDEFLTAQQIQGYFSRTAAKLKHATSQSAHVTDDNDLLAAQEEEAFTSARASILDQPVEAAPDIPATAATGTPITIPTPVSEVATAPEDRAAVTAPRQTTE
ncbi:hypothetical protein ACROYT_G031304 [Oculina patagonica]